MILRRILVYGVAISLGACSSDLEEDRFYVFSEFYDFNEGLHGWTGDFADYPVEDSIFYELQVDHVPLPSNLGDGKSLMISGNNHSDDLFMFIKKKVVNLEPNKEYTIAFTIKFATNASLGSVGVGGSPGQSVFLKAGAYREEPKKMIQGNYYIMNIDKGNQSAGGEDMTIVGNIAKSSESSDYALEIRNTPLTFSAMTNDWGELWLIVGTDSGFEGLTTLYYTEIGVVLSISDGK